MRGAAAGDLKDAELAGDFIESRKLSAWDDDACDESTVSGHRRKTAHPQPFVLMGIADVGNSGDQYASDDVDFAASLPALFSLDAARFAGAAFSRRFTTSTDRIGYLTTCCR